MKEPSQSFYKNLKSSKLVMGSLSLLLNQFEVFHKQNCFFISKSKKILQNYQRKIEALSKRQSKRPGSRKNVVCETMVITNFNKLLPNAWKLSFWLWEKDFSQWDTYIVSLFILYAYFILRDFAHNLLFVCMN